MRRTTLSFASVVALAALAASAAWSDTTDPPQPAAWTEKNFEFSYFGFTTTYSCDGLQDAVKSALLQFGARKDLTVRQSGCANGPGRPTPFPGVRVKMYILQPVDPAAGTSIPAPPVTARWKTIPLKLNSNSVSTAPGTCELVEQIKQKILPLFTTRNLKFSATCVPHQQSVTGPQLTVDVLIADSMPVKK